MLNIQQLSFSYGKKKVLDRLDIQLKPGELLAIMGPSGCGKSTLLNLIAGLRKPTEGSIETNARRIAYVFQEPRLFPWLTVTENLYAVMDRNHPDKENTAADALQTVELSDSAQLYPSALSGGMKSRASLARALVSGGDLYLLDEPFAALDAEMRRSLATALRQKLKQSNASAILVTHQLEDAQCFADRICRITEL